MNLYLADLHLRHQSIALQRGFSSCQEHDETVFLALCGRSDPNSTLFILGDLFSYRADPRLLERLAALPGARVLFQGNHEDQHWLRHFTDAPLLARTFTEICRWSDISDLGRPVRMSHFPDPDLEPGGDAYYLYGHLHRNPPRAPRERELCAKPRVLNASLDVISLTQPWGLPCTLEELTACNRLWKGEWE